MRNATPVATNWDTERLLSKLRHLTQKPNILMDPQSKKKKLPGLADEDYYLTREGFVVFTAAYHLKRGYCCKNGCRHCPYGFKKDNSSVAD